VRRVSTRLPLFGALGDRRDAGAMRDAGPEPEQDKHPERMVLVVVPNDVVQAGSPWRLRVSTPSDPRRPSETAR
jgi:hypothetical protein